MRITAEEREQIRKKANVSAESPQCLQPRPLRTMGSIEYCVKRLWPFGAAQEQVGVAPPRPQPTRA